MSDVMVAKDIYQNAKMGILGIDEVIYKIKNPKLLKEVKQAKDNYIHICLMCEKYLKSQKEKAQEPKTIAKMSSEVMTQMKLFKDDSDQIIIDMMLKGTKKSLDIIDSKKDDYKDYDRKVKKIINSMSKTLNESLENLKRIYKLYFFES